MELLFFSIYMFVFWGGKLFLSENIYWPLGVNNYIVDLVLMFSIGFFVAFIRRLFYSNGKSEGFLGYSNYVIDKLLLYYFWHVLVGGLVVYYVVCISDDNYFNDGARELGFSIFVFCFTQILLIFIELFFQKIKRKVSCT